MSTGIPCMLIRGGTSKGVYFLARDLPADSGARDTLILSIMGSPDARQIDGLGGAHPLTSKVAIVSPSAEPDCDIDFLFGQIIPERADIDVTPNCGNILAGIGPFAVERGLVAAADPLTRVRVRTVNTGTVAELVLHTPGGRLGYAGNARIDGVPGTAAPIAIDFPGAAGSVCGSLLPTGHAVDRVADIAATLIDNGMPVVVIAAGDVGRTGYESREVLNSDMALKGRLEEIRRAAGQMMGLGDVSDKVIPKIVVVAPPVNGGHICTRSFIPHECHTAIGVFAAVSVASACILPQSPAAKVATVPEGVSKTLSVEHPTGELSVRIEAGGTADHPVVARAGLLRTARLLFDGVAFPKEDIVAALASRDRDRV